MQATGIQWTDVSSNPIRARRKDRTGRSGHYCEKISPGCANCYSGGMQHRFGLPNFPGARKLPVLPVLREGGTCVSVSEDLEVQLDERELIRLRRSARLSGKKVFLCDMTDLFGSWVPAAWLKEIFTTMAASPDTIYQILTKRPENMSAFVRRWMSSQDGCESPPGTFQPLPNVWLGVSVENQQTADERIPQLLRTPAAVRFLSVEPLLGPVDLNLGKEVMIDLMDADPQRSERHRGTYPFPHAPAAARTRRSHAIHWVIVGGESGPRARPCPLEAVRSIVQQCAAAGVACFVKQLGREVVIPHSTGNERADALARKHGLNLIEEHWFPNHRKGGDPAEWPEDLRVRQFPGSCLQAGEEAGLFATVSDEE